MCEGNSGVYVFVCKFVVHVCLNVSEDNKKRKRKKNVLRAIQSECLSALAMKKNQNKNGKRTKTNFVLFRS